MLHSVIFGLCRTGVKSDRRVRYNLIIRGCLSICLIELTDGTSLQRLDAWHARTPTFESYTRVVLVLDRFRVLTGIGYLTNGKGP